MHAKSGPHPSNIAYTCVDNILGTETQRQAFNSVIREFQCSFFFFSWGAQLSVSINKAQIKPHLLSCREKEDGNIHSTQVALAFLL